MPTNNENTLNDTALSSPAIDSEKLVPNDVHFTQGHKYDNQSAPIKEVKRKKKDDYCHSFLSREIHLNNDVTQRLFERSYENVEYAIYGLGIADRGARSRQLSEEMMGKITHILDTLQAQLANGKTAILTAFDTHAIPENLRHPQSTGFRLYKADFSSPYTYRFLDIILMLDEMITLIDAAWINGIIDQLGYRQSIDQWLAIIRQAIKDIHQLRKEYTALAFGDKKETKTPANAPSKRD